MSENDQDSGNDPKGASGLLSAGDLPDDLNLKRSYLDYAMSVIVSRSIPDVRDGLKPVHRRLLHCLYFGGFTSDSAATKSAKIVGTTMGLYHPHGSAAVYDALMRMGQNFAARMPLVTIEGNSGSASGDQPAAMRYTAVKLSKAGEAVVGHSREGVNHQLNYDGTEKEPEFFHSRLPNILINGASGIAVGMATSIPPHNPSEVIDALLLLLDRPDATLDEILEVLPAPDFPTGESISVNSDYRTLYETGQGTVSLLGRVAFEERTDGSYIVVENHPKHNFAQYISENVIGSRYQKIHGVFDESYDGKRITALKLAPDVPPRDVLSEIGKELVGPVSANYRFNALVNGKPEKLNLRQILKHFITFRLDSMASEVKANLDHEVEKIRRSALHDAISNNFEAFFDLLADRGNAHSLAGSVWEFSPKVRNFLMLTDKLKEVPRPMGIRLSEQDAKYVASMTSQDLLDLKQEDQTAGMLSSLCRVDSLLRDKDLSSLTRRMKIELLDLRTTIKTRRRSSFCYEIGLSENSDFRAHGRARREKDARVEPSTIEEQLTNLEIDQFEGKDPEGLESWIAADLVVLGKQANQTSSSIDATFSYVSKVCDSILQPGD